MSLLEGYEPDDAGIKHSQNYCCNESGAIVLTLQSESQNISRKKTNKKNTHCDVTFKSEKQSNET